MTPANYRRCPVCDTFAWMDRHVCPSVWMCRLEGNDNDWSTIYALDPEDAAERFAEQYDSGGEYTIVREGEARVEVQLQDRETIKLFEVTAESVPQYSAREIRDEKKDDL